MVVVERRVAVARWNRALAQCVRKPEFDSVSAQIKIAKKKEKYTKTTDLVLEPGVSIRYERTNVVLF